MPRSPKSQPRAVEIARAAFVEMDRLGLLSKRTRGCGLGEEFPPPSSARMRWTTTMETEYAPLSDYGIVARHKISTKYGPEIFDPVGRSTRKRT